MQHERTGISNLHELLKYSNTKFTNRLKIVNVYY